MHKYDRNKFTLTSVDCYMRHDRLKGIHLKFANGYSVAQGCLTLAIIKRFRIKPSDKRIKYISAKVFENNWPDFHSHDWRNKKSDFDNGICGLKMIDPDNRVIFQIETKFSQGKWETLEVPEGE